MSRKREKKPKLQAPCEPGCVRSTPVSRMPITMDVLPLVMACAAGTFICPMSLFQHSGGKGGHAATISKKGLENLILGMP